VLAAIGADSRACPPWEQVLILIARRPLLPGERIGLVLTEGSAFNLKLNGISGGLRALTGAKLRRRQALPPRPD
jgi:hypothetical protein